mmetsp:Transcript_73459/g.238938  ORF Transcript_73459/g.238938 Transcript_73459/m.238938 type:complete len:405 (-) Transcript_73459:95-1309(-)
MQKLEALVLHGALAGVAHGLEGRVQQQPGRAARAPEVEEGDPGLRPAVNLERLESQVHPRAARNFSKCREAPPGLHGAHSVHLDVREVLRGYQKHVGAASLVRLRRIRLVLRRLAWEHQPPLEPRIPFDGLVPQVARQRRVGHGAQGLVDGPPINTCHPTMLVYRLDPLRVEVLNGAILGHPLATHAADEQSAILDCCPLGLEGLRTVAVAIGERCALKSLALGEAHLEDEAGAVADRQQSAAEAHQLAEFEGPILRREPRLEPLRAGAPLDAPPAAGAAGGAWLEHEGPPPQVRVPEQALRVPGVLVEVADHREIQRHTRGIEQPGCLGRPRRRHGSCRCGRRRDALPQLCIRLLKGHQPRLQRLLPHLEIRGEHADQNGQQQHLNAQSPTSGHRSAGSRTSS